MTVVAMVAGVPGHTLQEYLQVLTIPIMDRVVAAREVIAETVDKVVAATVGEATVLMHRPLAVVEAVEVAVKDNHKEIQLLIGTTLVVVELVSMVKALVGRLERKY
jgi:hypothetical protein